MRVAQPLHCVFQFTSANDGIMLGAMRIGSTWHQHSVSDIRTDCRFPVPPLPEQRAIAGALGDVDALLGALDQLIAKKRDLKQAAMQQLLTGQTRLPGFSGEWEVKTTSEMSLDTVWNSEAFVRTCNYTREDVDQALSSGLFERSSDTAHVTVACRDRAGRRCRLGTVRHESAKSHLRCEKAAWRLSRAAFA